MAIRENLTGFVDKAIVITGTSRVIGRGIALPFASEGADLVVSSNEQRKVEVAEEVRGLGRRALPVLCDVTRKAEVDALYDQALEALGRVGVSIQNADVSTISRIGDLTEKKWDRIMAG
jgi:meso-butanediol dehydrogenase/(S,S)-butanediol dehydrogenase/diacetyl reductase